jgi:hypothetical protein
LYRDKYLDKSGGGNLVKRKLLKVNKAIKQLKDKEKKDKK